MRHVEDVGVQYRDKKLAGGCFRLAVLYSGGRDEHNTGTNELFAWGIQWTAPLVSNGPFTSLTRTTVYCESTSSLGNHVPVRLNSTLLTYDCPAVLTVRLLRFLRRSLFPHFWGTH